MKDCCDKSADIDALRERQSGTLKIVLAINAVMFVVIMAAALYSESSALLADSLDNFGDAFTYALSLWAVALGTGAKARVAFVKGVLILLAALAILAQIVYRLMNPTVPLFEVMGIFSLLALAANGTCLALLWRHKSEDVNMSSVWACSRNDIVANISVFVAAGAVWLTASNWPDLLVAAFLVVFLMQSARSVLSSARAEIKSAG